MRFWRVVGWLVGLASLVPAAVLTTVRVVEPEIGSAVRLESFTPLALPLYAAGLVLLLVVAVARGRGRRLPVLALALLVVVALGVHAWWFSPMVSGDTPPPGVGAETVTVMNSNLFEGHGDAIELVQRASDAGADILVVEEVTGADVADMESAGIDEILPHRIGHPNGTVNGTMVFSSLPLSDETPIPTRHDSWRVQAGDLTLLAVHPVAPVTPGEWRTDLATVLAAAESADADLVVGDFNATPDHAPLRALADAGWRDAVELTDGGWQPTWPANGLGPSSLLPPVVAIDHVLVGSALTATSTHTVDIPGTDHRALVADLVPRAS